MLRRPPLSQVEVEAVEERAEIEHKHQLRDAYHGHEDLRRARRRRRGCVARLALRLVLWSSSPPLEQRQRQRHRARRVRSARCAATRRDELKPG